MGVGELGHELCGETGGVGGRVGRSDGLSLSTSVSGAKLLGGWGAVTGGVRGAGGFWGAKLKGFPLCDSAEGGGEGCPWVDMHSVTCGCAPELEPDDSDAPMPHTLSSRAAASLRMWGGMSRRLLTRASSGEGGLWGGGRGKDLGSSQETAWNLHGCYFSKPSDCNLIAQQQIWGYELYAQACKLGQASLTVDGGCCVLSFNMLSISWKNPVSWMLCTSMKMLWEGSKELFTASVEAAMLPLPCTLAQSCVDLVKFSKDAVRRSGRAGSFAAVSIACSLLSRMSEL